MYISQKVTNLPSLVGVAQKMCPHALFKFKMVLTGNPFWVQLCTSNFVKSWHLMSTLCGKNLGLISQTTFEQFKINQFSLITLALQMDKIPIWRAMVKDSIWLILNYLKVVWDIKTKFLSHKVLMRCQLLTKFEVHSCTQNGFPAKTILNFSRARQAYLWKGISLEYVQMVK